MSFRTKEQPHLYTCYKCTCSSGLGHPDPSSSFFWFLDLLKDQESSLKTEEKVSREVLTGAPSSIPTLSWGKPAGLSPEVMLVCLASLHFSYLEVTSHLQICVRASKVTDLGIKHTLRLSCE